ncbi:MAG: thiolase family protein [Promethearchaeota archaeon]
MPEPKPMYFTFASNPKREPVLVDYIRTPIGKKRGKMVRLRADDMMVLSIKELVGRTKILETGRLVDDVIVGCNSQIGEVALDVGRTSALAAGLDYRTPGVSVNRQCASGMQAVLFAWQQIATGQNDIVIAGGVEGQNKYPIMADMTVDGKVSPPNKRIVTENQSVIEASKRDAEAAGKFGPRLAKMAGQLQSAELIGHVWKCEREELDRLSLHSQKKACDPANAEKRQKEMFPVEVPKLDENGKPIFSPAGDLVEGQTETCDQDESPRPGTSLEIMAKLRPIVLRKSGLLTAGNSCPTSDGAAALLWVARGVAEEYGLPIRATLVGCAVVGTDPILMLTGPIESVPKVLDRCETTLDDMDFIEINEAFSTVVYASCKELGIGWDDARLNPWGGAIAIGHPTGMTGCRLLGTLTHQLEESGKTYGLGTLCVGLGMGFAGIVKREGA